MSVSPRSNSHSAPSGALALSVGTQVAFAGGECPGQGTCGTRSTTSGSRGRLDHAEHNMGGWRDRAIGEADNAIREPNAGCAYADTH